MKFTLLFYTDGWESGPTVELSHIPAPGSIVWTGGGRRGGGAQPQREDRQEDP